MPKTWTELTPGEIDALEGDALSWAVGEAMGYRVFVGSCTMQLCAERDGGMRYWRPHNDANQALEVWAAMPKKWSPYLELDADNEACVYLMHGRWCSHGDFCTAICRAYLKAKFEDDHSDE